MARRFRTGLFALLLAMTAVLSIAAAGTANATDTTGDASIAATCYYEVSQNATPYINVRTGPGTDYTVYRTKTPGEVVSGPCGYHYYTYRTGYWWTRLYKYDGSYVYAASIYLLER